MCLPAQEELENGSAMEKAITLITARDELTAKIQQLEAVAAAHATIDTSQHRMRTTSFSAQI